MLVVGASSEPTEDPRRTAISDFSIIGGPRRYANSPISPEREDEARDAEINHAGQPRSDRFILINSVVLRTPAEGTDIGKRIDNLYIISLRNATIGMCRLARDIRRNKFPEDTHLPPAIYIRPPMYK